MEEEILGLAQAKGARAEVFGEDRNRTVVEFKANEFHSQQTRLTRGYGLRVVKNGRVGFSSSSNPDVVDDLVAAAVETAVLGKPCRFSFPSPEVKPAVKTFDNRVIVLRAEKMIEWGRELVEAVTSRVPGLKLDVTISRDYGETVLLNSEGLDARYSRAALEIWATGLLVNDGLVWITEYQNLSSGAAPAIGELADRIEERARHARARARIATGTYPVIFMPTALPNLLFPIAYGWNGKRFEKGTSPLIGRVGRQVLGPEITIADNGLRDFGTMSSPLDAEGVPRRRTVMFDSGVFKGFLFDLATAAACRTRSTGSARRGFTDQPQPGSSNIEVEPGDAGFKETLSRIRDGLVVYECIGGGQSNVLAGEVALSVSSAYRVEGGKVSGRVKDAAIAGNVYEMFTKVAAVGKTCRDLGSYHAPFVMFEGLRVAARD